MSGYAFILENAGPLTVGLGVFLGLVWTRRTGWGCGGIITPGLLALHAADPVRMAGIVVVGLALTPAAMLASRVFGLYGRERIGAAMLFALAASMLLPYADLPVDTRWTGWVVPGLIAAEADRQGVPMTLVGTISCTVATSFCAGLLTSLIGGLP